MKGNITSRGKNSWRLKYDVPTEGGQRKTVFTTVRGSRKDAERELRRRLSAIDNGTHVDPSGLTVAEYIRAWLDNDTDLSPKTLERYRQLAERQIIPHLGAIKLQRLQSDRVKEWHKTLLKSGSSAGEALSARTVGHAHRVLRRGIELARQDKKVFQNAAQSAPPPKVAEVKLEILDSTQIGDVLAKLEGHPVHPIAAVALATGMRRGEICGLAWSSVDLDRGVLKVERSLEETAKGLRFKEPKTSAGRRSIAIPTATVELLRVHRRAQLELRLKLGVGRGGDDDLVFPLLPNFSPWPPDKLSRDWGNVVRYRKLPRVSFHSLRHSHASALISAGVDVGSVSRRLGHSNPAITLKVYTHQFERGEQAALDAIAAVLAPRN
jgi:integrase